MSLTRLSQLPRLLNTGLRAQQQLAVRFKSRRGGGDDLFFNVASSLMRNLENEFDRMRSSMLRDVWKPTMSIMPRIFDSPQLTAAELPTESDVIRVDDQGNRKFHLDFDLAGFEPEEIKVETKGGTLTLSAKKERKSDTSYILREFSQSYSLPEDLKLEDLKSKWSSNGILTIEAPLPKQLESSQKQQDKEKEIKILHHGSQESGRKEQPPGTVSGASTSAPGSTTASGISS